MPCNSTLRKSLGPFLAVAFLSASPAWAQNQLTLPDVTLPACSTGQGIFVHASHDIALSGFQLSLRYQPAALTVTGVTSAGTSLPADVGFFKGTIKNGQIIWGVVMDLNNPTATLPPSEDRLLVQIVVDVLMLPGDTSQIEFVDGQGTPPINNILVDDKALPLRPALEPGLITCSNPVNAEPPQARAGPDLAAAELTVVTLDGSQSTSCMAPAYLWKQVSGPTAQALSALNGPQAQFSLPGVDGDTALSFELLIDDGLHESTDRVTVTALDLDLRKGTLSAPQGRGGLIDGGSRALVFEGTIQWGTAVEEADWKGLRFSARGDGDESALLSGASLYVDTNGDGAIDGGDRQIGGQAALTGDNAQVSFTFNEHLKAGPATRFFLVVDVVPRSGQAAGLVLFPLLLAAGLFGLAGERTGRRGRAARGSTGRSLLILLVLAALPLIAPACGGGGGGGKGAAPAQSRGVRFDLLDPSDVTLIGSTSGVAGKVVGLPIQGPALEV